MSRDAGRGRVALPLQLWEAGYWSCYPPRRLGGGSGRLAASHVTQAKVPDLFRKVNRRARVASKNRNEAGRYPKASRADGYYVLMLLVFVIITMANARCPGYVRPAGVKEEEVGNFLLILFQGSAESVTLTLRMSLGTMDRRRGSVRVVLDVAMALEKVW
ncbi:hypothetical protein CP532_1852 [Ophiocordyceps camponoti-leonardi (nom. inval.)]|nr:hypothetical protein CP532_1852 [Ophiocordyceps camponoti-leonardi (nom. inval.)]